MEILSCWSVFNFCVQVTTNLKYYRDYLWNLRYYVDQACVGIKLSQGCLYLYLKFSTKWQVAISEKLLKSLHMLPCCLHHHIFVLVGFNIVFYFDCSMSLFVMQGLMKEKLGLSWKISLIEWKRRKVGVWLVIWS